MDNNSGGIGLLGVLEIVFIVLKLLGIITWSWWIVLIPLWIDITLVICCIIAFMIVTKSRW